jgi:hypothetical protein
VLNPEHPVTIVANRDGLPDKYSGCFDYRVRENRGLEYGAYDYYLKNIWDGDDVLFMHDDMAILPIMKNFEIIGPELLFKSISEFKDDLVYIFKNDTSRRECFEIHGRAMFASKRWRAMFASKRFLRKLLDCGGFPWDKNNDGYTLGPNPGYCEHFNWAVAQLKMFWEKLFDYKIDSIIIPAFDYKIRGEKH